MIVRVSDGYPTRQMTLTPCGHQLWSKAELLLSESESLFAVGSKENSQDMTGRVRVTLPPLFENLDIVGHLLRSLEPYPDLTIEWLPADMHLKVIYEKINIWIRKGAIPDNRFIVKTIRPVRISIVAAPDLIKQLGMPDSLKTLQYEYPLNALSNSNSGRVRPWQFADGDSFFPANP
ncbi:TPA: hypothetical protein OT849_000287 [Enterobacter cloacae]|nr:hypothetical protein [Enterobacter cloacae]